MDIVNSTLGSLCFGQTVGMYSGGYLMERCLPRESRGRRVFQILGPHSPLIDYTIYGT